MKQTEIFTESATEATAVDTGSKLAEEVNEELLFSSDGTQAEETDESEQQSNGNESELSEINRICRSEYKDSSSLPNYERYKTLRESGLSIEEALRAVNFDILAKQYAEEKIKRATEAALRAEAKAHLTSSRIRPVGGNVLTGADITELRKWGLDYSERELERLWLSTEQH